MTQNPRETRDALSACTTGSLINLTVPGFLYEVAGTIHAQTIDPNNPYVKSTYANENLNQRRENHIRALTWDIARSVVTAILFLALKDSSPVISDIAGYAALVYGFSAIVMAGQVAIDNLKKP